MTCETPRGTICRLTRCCCCFRFRRWHSPCWAAPRPTCGSRNAVLDFVLRTFPDQFEFITTSSIRSWPVRWRSASPDRLRDLGRSLGFFGAISTAVNYAWGVEKARSFWKHKLFFLVSDARRRGTDSPVALLLVSASGWLAPAGSTSSSGTSRVGRAAKPCAPQRRHGVVHPRRRADLLLRAECEGAAFADVWLGALLTGLLWKVTLVGFACFHARHVPVYRLA